MKIISRNVNEFVPNFKESDYFKSIVLSIVNVHGSENKNIISYIVRTGDKFYLTGISQKNYNDKTSSTIWCNTFNHADTVLQLMHNETTFCVNADCPTPVYYIIDNYKDLNSIISNYNITGKFQQELINHLKTKLEDQHESH